MKDQKDLKGTKTERNLQEAFAGESQARNKYTYFASKAKKTVSSRLQQFSKRQLRTKKSMQRCGISFSTAEISVTP